ncbi:MAG: hypothetical protein HZB70_03990 [Candidatus Berkelbacteria bacterium]|nr:MAG: hypothetical protein HZB70_03990 [Candidatus Berkelbacteria bacterium]QQG51539.1 MAG: hypothetical protein HY845_03200 [Candidatus Berkelbacteria bacterium]
MNIAIIGDSPFAFLLARELDQDVARHAHVDIKLLTREDRLANLLDHRSGTAWKTINKRSALRHVALRAEAVKSVSLREKRLTTTKEILPYDILVVDQAPHFTSEELSRIEASIHKLILAVKSKPKSRAAINFQGEDASTWQLALLIKGWLGKQHIQDVALTIPPTQNKALNDFLKGNGLMLGRSKDPGITVAPCSPVVSPNKLKGAHIDRLDCVVSDAKALAKGYRDVLVRSGDASTNLWRAEQTRAKLFSSQIARLVENEALRPLELEGAALGLSGNNGALTIVGSSQNTGLRAKTIIGLDLAFWRNLLRRYH